MRYHLQTIFLNQQQKLVSFNKLTIPFFYFIKQISSKVVVRILFLLIHFQNCLNNTFSIDSGLVHHILASKQIPINMKRLNDFRNIINNRVFIISQFIGLENHVLILVYDVVLVSSVIIEFLRNIQFRLQFVTISQIS